MRRTAARSALLAAGLAGGLLSAGEGAAQQILIRATSPLPNAVQDVLAQIGEPLSWELDANETAEYAMRHHCGGSFTEHYRAQLIAANPQMAPFEARTEKRSVTLPACAKVKARAEVNVLVGDDLASLLERELGAKPDTKLMLCKSATNANAAPQCTVVAARKAVADQMNWAESDLDVLRSDSQIVLPFSSRWTVVTLKSGVTPQSATAMLEKAASVSLAGADLLRVEEAHPTSLIGLLQSNDPVLQTGNCAVDASVPATWPFDRVAVKSAILDAHAYLKSKKFDVRHTVIRIADTGIAGIGKNHGFPEIFLAENVHERHGNSRSDLNRPTNRFNGDRFGIDAEGFGNVEALHAQPDRLHGSHVADLALGGRAFRDGVTDLYQFIQLNFARLFRQARGGTSFEVNTGTVLASFTAEPQFADVINLSIGGVKSDSTIYDALKSLTARRQLVVIAAGNDGQSLALKVVYPASHADDPWLHPAMLVVGAHGIDGKRTRFSNYGKSHVDLLAPGCRLHDSFNAKSDAMLAGTSFAAPLVTFTASLLRAFLGATGTGESTEIKARLHASSRYVDNVETQYTRFGGNLDIAAALRVFDDIVRLPDGTLVIGRWTRSRTQVKCNHQPISLPPELVQRIRVEKTSGTELPRLGVLHRSSGGTPGSSEIPCEAVSNDGPTMQLEDRRERHFHWSEIESFIPAHHPHLIRLDPAPATTVTPAGVPFSAVTLPAITALLGSGVAKASQSPTAATLVARIQEQLANIGFYTGNVDGTAGALTDNAIRMFQVGRNEQPNGVLSDRQVRALAALNPAGDRM